MMLSMIAMFEHNEIPFEMRELCIHDYLQRAFKIQIPLFRATTNQEFDDMEMYHHAKEWYRLVYDGCVRKKFIYGKSPIKMLGTFWEFSSPVLFPTAEVEQGIPEGKVSSNPLDWVVGMNDVAKKVLPKSECQVFCDFSQKSHGALRGAANALNKLTGTPQNLLWHALTDYDASTLTFMDGAFSQSKWASQQACEKLIKTVNFIHGTSLDVLAKDDGHCLKSGAKRLNRLTGLTLKPEVLFACKFGPEQRYAPTMPTQNECYEANHAVIEVMSELVKRSLL